MKLCPHCSAELRDSVIKCVHCGRSLKEAPAPAADESSAPSPGPLGPPSSASSSAWAPPREEKLGWWSPNASKPKTTEDVEPNAATATTTDDVQTVGKTATDLETEPAPVATRTPEPVSVARVETQSRPAWTGKPDAWATPARVPERAPTTTPPQQPRHMPAHPPEEQDLRALPVEKRSNAHPDFVLLLAGAAAVAVAAVAWQAVAEPWVQLRITDPVERGADPVFVGDMIIRGKGALIGTIAHALAGIIGALGVMWFLFGFDKGWTLRWFANPAIGVLTAIGGLAAAGISMMLWFVWEDAAVQRARALGKTPEKLQELLDQQPTPLVEIVRQPGLVRFAVMMGIGLVAACVAMAAANKRG